MRAERWKSVEDLYEAASALPPEKRAGFLHEACCGDPELRAEVESLLKAAEAGNSLLDGSPLSSIADRRPALKPGDKLESFEVMALLGRGGMGVVYRARDTRLKREVALKVLPDAFASDPDRMARFEREARVLASLNHPHIAQIYGVEKRALVMELVTGESPKGPMAFDDAWKIAAQIAEALEYAHEKGIVHRDLKPQNIKVTPEGVVKLLDFGLAKAFAAQGGSSVDVEDSPTTTMGATQAGMILGTPSYMAPEQAKGQSVDPRADIWAFGVVLYELLAGRRPFRGGDVLAAVLHEAPDLGPIPPRACPLLESCLEKDPKKRLRHVGDARLLLGGYSGTAPAAPSRSRILIGALALVTLLLAAVSFLHFREQSPPQEAALVSVLLPEKSRPLSLAVSPDGRWIAVVLVKGGKQQLWVRALDALEPAALDGTDGAADPFWSPDSRSIGFFADAKLKTTGRSGGPVQTLCDALGVRGGTWNRNGDILFGGLARLQRVSSAGGAVSDLPKHAAVTEVYPFFLPDGRHFLATRPGLGTQSGVWLGSIDGPEVRHILPDSSNAEFVKPPPGSRVGEVLFTRAGTLMALPFDMNLLEPGGDAFPVAQRIAAGIYPYWLAATSEQGTLAYVFGRRGGRQYVWRDRQGRTLGAFPDAGEVAMISPDGKRLVGDRGGDTWVLEFARGVATRLTFGPPTSFNPIWSPDGRYVAYDKLGAGICRKPANGVGVEELLVPRNKLAVPKSWSPDGEFIVYAQINPGTGADLLAIPVTGDRKPFVVVQTPGTDDQGQFSPDGHWLAYTSNESGQSEIYVIPFPPSAGGGKWLVSRSGGVQPRWRRDGKELFYISLDSKMMSVEVDTGHVFQSGTPHPLFQTEMVDTGIRTGPMSWDLAPDGNRFLIISENSTDALSLNVALNWRAVLAGGHLVAESDAGEGGAVRVGYAAGHLHGPV